MNTDLQAASSGAATKEPGQSKREAFDPVKLLTAAQKALASAPPEPTTVSGAVLAEINRTMPTQTGGRSPKKIWPDEIFRGGSMIQAHPEKTLAAIINGN